MIGRLFGFLWLMFIFTLGFGAGAVYWNYHQWTEKTQGHDFISYISHTLHLSQEQEKLLEKAVASKDEKIEQLKKSLEPKFDKARDGAKERLRQFWNKQGETS